jgi:energy-coupling factor transport system ATP-binding protein
MEIRLEEVSVNVLDQITLHIPSNQFVLIMGGSESGKTSLIHLMLGLLRPPHGRVEIGGFHFNLLNNPFVLQRLRQQMGVVFQHTHHQIIGSSIYEDIAFSLKLKKKLSKSEIDHMVRQSMEKAGLSYEDFKDKSPYRLSGGEMRRAALAEVIINQPKLLLLDEPEQGMDPEGMQVLEKVMKDFRHHATVIYCCKTLQWLDWADRLIVLDKGQIVYDELVNQINIDYKLLKQWGVLVPPIVHLIEAFEDIDPDWLPSHIVTEEQLFLFLKEVWGTKRL